jgi:hypothetical protein
MNDEIKPYSIRLCQDSDPVKFMEQLSSAVVTARQAGEFPLVSFSHTATGSGFHWAAIVIGRQGEHEIEIKIGDEAKDASQQ